MKKLFAFLLFLGILMSASFAQDVIVKLDATEIPAKVLVVGVDEISYKKWNFQDGPTYQIKKQDVFYIKYSNGMKDVFTTLSPDSTLGKSDVPQRDSFVRGGGKGSGVGTGRDGGGGIGYGEGNRGYTYMPDLTVSETGQVFVEVHIDTDGNVLDARIIDNSKYPTTIANRRIQAECVAKAKTAKYKKGKEELRIIVFK
ncbi:MAG: hypothetical protein MJZ46_07270 [Bacteroidales bacterium]|nr:hypothetical protein [Bacteroidales bacterium]